MSSVLVDSLPQRRPRAEQPTRQIEIVSTRAQRRARPRPLYALIAIGGLFVLFMAQLLMSIVVSDGAYKISSLQSTQADFGRQAQRLGEKLDTLASTQNLATKAESLGMVQSAATPAFLDVATGKVTGVSQSAEASSTGVLDSTGNLVPNALLPDAAVDDGTVVDAASTAAADAPAGSTPTVDDGVTVGGTADTTTAATGTTTGTAGTTPAAGAPAATVTPAQVPSSNALAVPVTH